MSRIFYSSIALNVATVGPLEKDQLLAGLYCGNQFCLQERGRHCRISRSDEQHRETRSLTYLVSCSKCGVGRKRKARKKILGTAFSYVGVHMQTLKNGATILYHPGALVLWRSNNDLFYTGDLAARVMLDLNGYRQIADDVLKSFPALVLRSRA